MTPCSCDVVWASHDGCLSQPGGVNATAAHDVEGNGGEAHICIMGTFCTVDAIRNMYDVWT